MDIFGIAAEDKTYLMGNGPDLPWKDDEGTKWDMDNFKNTTMNHPVIMGYNTFLTMKKPLKNRFNIVINTHDSVHDNPIIVDVKDISSFNKYDIFDKKYRKFYMVKSLDEAIQLCINISLINKSDEYETAFIIGGSKIYNEALQKNLLNGFKLTTFYKEYPDNKGRLNFPYDILKKNFTKISSIEKMENSPGCIEDYFSINNPPSQKYLNKKII